MSDELAQLDELDERSLLEALGEPVPQELLQEQDEQDITIEDIEDIIDQSNDDIKIEDIEDDTINQNDGDFDIDNIDDSNNLESDALSAIDEALQEIEEEPQQDQQAGDENNNQDKVDEQPINKIDTTPIDDEDLIADLDDIIAVDQDDEELNQYLFAPKDDEKELSIDTSSIASIITGLLENKTLEITIKIKDKD